MLPPRVISLPAQIARVGEAYWYDLDGRPAAQGSRPLIWSLGRSVDGQVVNAPAGMRIAGASGELTWTPDEDQQGQNRASITVENDAGADRQEFIIDVTSETDRKGLSSVGVQGKGCGCVNSAAAPFWLALCAVALLLRERRLKSAKEASSHAPEMNRSR